MFSRLVGKYINNLSNHNQGTRLMFRSRQEREEQIKRSGGKRSKTDWYRMDWTTNIITVPTTPGGVLATKMAASLATCPAPGRCRREGVQLSRETWLGVILFHEGLVEDKAAS